jgi:hypothetical protein
MAGETLADRRGHRPDRLTILVGQQRHEQRDLAGRGISRAA